MKQVIQRQYFSKIMLTISAWTITFSSILFYSIDARAGEPLGNVGSFVKWGKVEIALTGPASTGTGDPNPFAIEVDTTFTSPAGQTFVVPGFYDGDGNGNLNGNLWKVRFSADETGSWNFSTQSTDSTLDGYTGSFTVSAAPSNAPDFYRWGRLEYTGAAGSNIRYFKFRDGPYWLKAGSDDPENLLGNFGNYDTLAERKAAMDYLASKGINSQYLMTDNIDGDGNDVWPWLGSTAAEAKTNAGSNARFNIAKLEEWRQLFEHMQTKGVVVYVVLEDDSAWTGFDHARYYREIIARFGYLPALMFNVGEEANESYSLAESLAMALQIKNMDPFKHPVGIHNVPLWPDISPNDTYLDNSVVDFTSLQTKGTDPLIHNQVSIDWIDRATTRGRRIPVVNFDEARPILDRKAWWSAYIGGGVWEAHTDQPYDRPMSAWQTIWDQLGGTRAFMETLPFWEMQPNNSLVSNGNAFVLAKAGESYALYLPAGGNVTISLPLGSTYAAAWWNPANNRSGAFQNVTTIDGGPQTLSAPGSGDWALRITKLKSNSGILVPQEIATGTYPDIALDSDGNIHVVYARGGKLRYKKFSISTKTWTAEQDTGITQLPSYRNDPDIAIDSNGRPHVVGGQGDGTGQYAYWDGTQWNLINVAINRDTDIAIDSSDNVYIISRGGNSGGFLGLWRRAAGASSFTAMSDPDSANGLPVGANDHVYGTIFINPTDDSLHIIYRHAAPRNASYRSSTDGGISWTGAGISDDDAEAPSGVAGADGSQYVITGTGTVFKLPNGGTSWSSLGNAVTAASRHLPNLATDESGNLYAVSFGGKYNVYSNSSWSGEQTVESLTSQSVGFMEAACAASSCYVVWEEGANVVADNDNVADNFTIVIAPMNPDGVSNPGAVDTTAPDAPTEVTAD